MNVHRLRIDLSPRVAAMMTIALCLFAIGANCDSDADGIADRLDNCPLIGNPGQEDQDANGIGDACDNANDNAAFTPPTDGTPIVPLSGTTPLHFVDTSVCEKDPTINPELNFAWADQSAVFEPDVVVSTYISAMKGDYGNVAQSCNPAVWIWAAPPDDSDATIEGTITCRVRHEGTVSLGADNYYVLLCLHFGRVDAPGDTVLAYGRQDSNDYEMCTDTYCADGQVPGGPFTNDTAVLTIPNAIFTPGDYYMLELTTHSHITSSAIDYDQYYMGWGGRLEMTFTVEDCRVTFPASP